MMVALAALAGGCARVIISDIADPKLDLIGATDGIETVNLNERDLQGYVAETTGNWGVDIVFEASGASSAVLALPNLVRPGGTVVLVGMPVEPVPFDITGLQTKEARIETVFRYANIYDKAINLVASGKVNLKPFISGTFDFDDSIVAFDRAVEGRPSDIKLQIQIEKTN
jgi:D-xylulose reductase